MTWTHQIKAKESPMNHVTVLGIDLAKNFFQSKQVSQFVDQLSFLGK